MCKLQFLFWYILNNSVVDPHPTFHLSGRSGSGSYPITSKIKNWQISSIHDWTEEKFATIIQKFLSERSEPDPYPVELFWIWIRPGKEKVPDTQHCSQYPFFPCQGCVCIGIRSTRRAKDSRPPQFSVRSARNPSETTQISPSTRWFTQNKRWVAFKICWGRCTRS